MVNQERILFDKLVIHLGLDGRYFKFFESDRLYLKNEELKKLVEEYQTLVFKIKTI